MCFVQNQKIRGRSRPPLLLETMDDAQTKHQVKQEETLACTSIESNPALATMTSKLALATKVVVTEQDETKPRWQELLVHADTTPEDIPSPTKKDVVPEDMDDEPGEIRSAAPHEEEVKEEVEVATDGVANTNSMGSPEKAETDDGSNSPMDTTGEDESPLDEIPTSLSNLGSLQKITLIEDRLNEAVAKVEPNVQNRSPDIVPLAKTYNVLRKKLRLLVAASKKYHETSLAQDKARAEVGSLM